jgi:hypothetical protein
LLALHGVSVLAPWSSFSVITGCAQAIEFDAYVYRRFARSTTVAGSAGSVGVPVRRVKLRSK